MNMCGAAVERIESVLRCVAACCSVLQRVAVFCRDLWYILLTGIYDYLRSAILDEYGNAAVERIRRLDKLVNYSGHEPPIEEPTKIKGMMVCVCMSIRVHVYTCLCICTCITIIYTSICIYLCMHTIYMYMYVYVYVYTCIYTYIHIYTYLYLYFHIYISISIFK